MDAVADQNDPAPYVMLAGIDLSPGNSALVVGDGGAAGLRVTHSEENVKADFLARRRMAQEIVKKMAVVGESGQQWQLVALEDYAQNPTQQVSYQIAETGGILKHELVQWGIPVMLVNPSKVKSMVSPHRFKGKGPVIEWAEKNGFALPAKRPGQPGLYMRQREDLADAFVLYTIAVIAYNLLVHYIQPAPETARIFTDPKTGLCRQTGLILNRGLIQ